MNIYKDIDPKRCYECGDAGGKQIEFGHGTKYPAEPGIHLDHRAGAGEEDKKANG